MARGKSGFKKYAAVIYDGTVPLTSVRKVGANESNTVKNTASSGHSSTDASPSTSASPDCLEVDLNNNTASREAWANVSSSVKSSTASGSEAGSTVENTASPQQSSTNGTEPPKTPTKVSGTLRITSAKKAVFPSAAIKDAVDTVKIEKKVKEPKPDAPIVVKKASGQAKVEKKKSQEKNKADKTFASIKPQVLQEPVVTRKKKVKKPSKSRKAATSSPAGKATDAGQKSDAEKSVEVTASPTEDVQLPIVASAATKSTSSYPPMNRSTSITIPVPQSSTSTSPPSVIKDQAVRPAAPVVIDSNRLAVLTSLIKLEMNKTQVKGGNDAVGFVNLLFQRPTYMAELRKNAGLDKVKLFKAMESAEIDLYNAFMPVYSRGIYYRPSEVGKDVKSTRGANISKEDADAIQAVDVANLRYRQACGQVAKQGVSQRELQSSLESETEEGDEKDVVATPQQPRKLAKVKSPKRSGSPQAEISCPVIASPTLLPLLDLDDFPTPTGLKFKVPATSHVTPAKTDDSTKAKGPVSPPRTPSFDFTKKEASLAAVVSTEEEKAATTPFVFGGVATTSEQITSDVVSEDVDQSVLVIASKEGEDSNTTTTDNTVTDKSDVEHDVDAIVTSAFESTVPEPPKHQDIDTAEPFVGIPAADSDIVSDHDSDIVSPTSPVSEDMSFELDAKVDTETTVSYMDQPGEDMFPASPVSEDAEVDTETTESHMNQPGEDMSSTGTVSQEIPSEMDAEADTEITESHMDQPGENVSLESDSAILPDAAPSSRDEHAVSSEHDEDTEGCESESDPTLSTTVVLPPSNEELVTNSQEPSIEEDVSAGEKELATTPENSSSIEDEDTLKSVEEEVVIPSKPEPKVIARNLTFQPSTPRSAMTLLGYNPIPDPLHANDEAAILGSGCATPTTSTPASPLSTAESDLFPRPLTITTSTPTGWLKLTPTPPSSLPSPTSTPRRRMNTQIGTTTLREFLLALQSPTATQQFQLSLVGAFLAVACVERAALDLGSSYAYDCSAETVLANQVLQHKIFLGHVKLAEFLRAVEFDGDGVEDSRAVVGAWEECARVDGEAEDLEMQFCGA
ncbi:hypothetical protein CC86DRAFT_404867 [Ophiobolus disseminans]|uniref:Uncharacterized protein n=1 Tax=Ophiobolus disseminans TaxID=1469910 RepID=A0A6A7A3X3_9PLEO|nr:hypothetical protein CC86DRAFT_404867 [Ophiobolus disseminans]